MRPVFVHNSKQYPILNIQFSDDIIREICYSDNGKMKFLYEENSYMEKLDMIKDLASHIKWVGKYDDLLNELVQLNEKKTNAFDDAAHEVAHSSVDTKANVDVVKNYHVLSGQVAVVDDVLALVSLLNEEEKSATEMAVPVTQ